MTDASEKYSALDKSKIIPLESLLWNNEHNYNNYWDLLKNYNKNYVSFIGAGVSVPLGIRDWKGLLEKLAKVAKEKHGFKQEIPSDSKEWPTFAENIYDYFDSNGNTKSYYDEISSGMISKYSSTSLTMVKLALALEEHLTTNFDRSLEYAYDFLLFLSQKFKSTEMSKEYEVRCIPDFGDYSKKYGKALIYYLHGNVEKNIYILRKSHYVMYYPSVSSYAGSNDLENLLGYYYRNRTLLFIGFSFSDYYLKEYFLKLSKQIEQDNLINAKLVEESGQLSMPKEIKHFLIIDEANDYFDRFKDKIFSIFNEFNIYPIIYKRGEHIFLEYLFDKLSSFDTGDSF